MVVSQSITLTIGDAQAYLEAVGDQNSLYKQSATMPPMAVAAFALDSIMKQVELPGRAIHSAQELEFFQPCTNEDSAYCVGKVIQNTVRSGIRFLTFLFNVTGSKGQILTGRTSILIPEDPVMQ